jgi:hypothetical protein
MKMRSSTLIGLALVIFGALVLAGNLLTATFGYHIHWFKIWRFWPTIVISVGLLITATPLLFRQTQSLGALYIPGIPILVTGGILFLASTLNNWNIWSFLWPLEVLAVALGFLFAALSTQLIGLGVPAIIIGLNGLVLQFCALTGFWGAWSFLWAIEPLAIGLVLLMFSLKYNSHATMIVGVSFCAFAGIALTSMIVLAFTGWWAFRYVGPLMMIAIGVLSLLLGVLKSPNLSNGVLNESSAS